MTKEVAIKKGSPVEPYEVVDNLQAAIDMAYGTTGQIHEGKINLETGYPKEYYVCDGDCK